jgi:LPXTG-site transpeptidase (sortase) family protein
MIYIPAINLIETVTITAPVIDNYYDEFDQYVIGDGVQWLSDSAWIDFDGRVVLAGHTPGVFDDLHLVEKGDQIVMVDAHRVVIYEVSGVFTAKASEKEWLRESSEPKILIITCSGENRLLIEGKPYESR